MQKNNNILLSHTGLKYYYKTDRKIFEQIKRQYLPKQWFESDLEKQIKEIAHNIRNAKANQKIKQIKIYQPQQINLLYHLDLNVIL
jgi:beta-lactamase class D